MYVKATILALAAGTMLAGIASSAVAEETTVIRKSDPPAAVVVPARPGVTVEKKSVETTGSGDCRSKTVHKEDEAGSTTVHKKTCD